MTADPTRFGADVRLLGNLEFQTQRDRGADLRVTTTLRESRVTSDLEAVSEVENLQQALLLRFLTPLGELEVLGHPTYGSRLHELIGELNSQSNRDRAKLYALQALQAEPRVSEVLRLTVTTRPGSPTWIDIRATVKALDHPTALNLVVPFDFSGDAP